MAPLDLKVFLHLCHVCIRMSLQFMVVNLAWVILAKVVLMPHSPVSSSKQNSGHVTLCGYVDVTVLPTLPSMLSGWAVHYTSIHLATVQLVCTVHREEAGNCCSELCACHARRRLGFKPVSVTFCIPLNKG